MRRGEALQAFCSQKEFMFGLLSILFITPLAGTLLMQVNMQPVELIIGLAIFVCMPTSLSANIALSGVCMHVPARQFSSVSEFVVLNFFD